MDKIINNIQHEIDQVLKLVREIYKTPEGQIYLHEPRFFGKEKEYLLDAIDSTFVSSVGEYVNRFEKSMAKIAGTKYAVALVSGTAALHIALKLANVEKNTEVLMQPLTFIATANAISYEGAIPHFVDVSKITLGLCPESLERRLKEIAIIKNSICYNKETGNRISACVPMHTFGFPSEIDKLVEVCNQYHIPLIEDAAESIGSKYKNKHTGSFGLIGTFSFNGNKTVTCGGGGAIVTNDEAIAKRAKHITTQAKIPHKWEYAHDEIGYNYRMPNLNAALACAQLEQLDYYIKNKRATAEMYADKISSIQNFSFIKEPEHCYSNYWLNAIQLKSKEDRDYFLEYANEKGVMCRPIWKLINTLEMYKDCPKGTLRNSEYFEDTIINLPSSVRI